MLRTGVGVGLCADLVPECFAVMGLVHLHGTHDVPRRIVVLRVLVLGVVHHDPRRRRNVVARVRHQLLRWQEVAAVPACARADRERIM